MARVNASDRPSQHAASGGAILAELELGLGMCLLRRRDSPCKIAGIAVPVAGAYRWSKSKL